MSKFNSEDWVAHTRSYQQLMQEVQRLQETMSNKAKEMEMIAKDRDEYVKELQLKNYYMNVSDYYFSIVLRFFKTTRFWPQPLKTLETSLNPLLLA